MSSECTVAIRIVDLAQLKALVAALSHWAGWVAEREEYGAVLNEFEAAVYAALTELWEAEAQG